jgi:hypothetical protein
MSFGTGRMTQRLEARIVVVDGELACRKVVGSGGGRVIELTGRGEERGKCDYRTGRGDQPTSRMAGKAVQTTQSRFSQDRTRESMRDRGSA